MFGFFLGWHSGSAEYWDSYEHETEDGLPAPEHVFNRELQQACESLADYWMQAADDFDEGEAAEFVRSCYETLKRAWDRPPRPRVSVPAGGL